jgi:hypothetical protein
MITRSTSRKHDGRQRQIGSKPVPNHYSADLDRIFGVPVQRVFEAGILAGGYVKGKLK